MTTTETTPPPATPAAPAAEKAPSILDAMKRGREYAALLVLVVTFAHSLYASYFKKEEVAEAGYKQTSDTIEDYSRVVHDEIETLKARIQDLEGDLDAVKEEKAATTQLLKVRPRSPKPSVKVEGVQIEGHPVGFPVAVAMPPDNPASLPELIQVDADGISDAPPAPDDPLIVDMPDRPWEQAKK